MSGRTEPPGDGEEGRGGYGWAAGREQGGLSAAGGFSLRRSWPQPRLGSTAQSPGAESRRIQPYMPTGLLAAGDQSHQR